MNGVASVVLAILSTLGSGGLIVGIIAWRKYGPEIRQLGADTRRTVAEAVALEQSAEDEHWERLIKAQTESLLKPLTEEVARQGVKIAELETAMKSLNRRYRLALDHLSDFVRYALRLVALLPADASPPPPPLISNEIADDM